MPHTQNNKLQHQSLTNRENSSIIVQHLRICKAKYQKQKYIKKQNKQQLKSYKQKMLKLVRKRSSQNAQAAQKKIEQFEQLNQNLNHHQRLFIQEAVINLEKQFIEIGCQQANKDDECLESVNRLLRQCQDINSQIQEQNCKEQQYVQAIADRIQSICMQSICE